MSSPLALFLAWQDPVSRAWFPIGRLETRSDGGYRFVYTRGFARAEQAGLTPLVGFPELDRVYDSAELFPLFKNRIMSPAREEYAAYLDRLALGEGRAAPLSILARSEGRRTTDSLEIFAHPLARDPGGGARYCLDFFVRGLRHRPESAQLRALALEGGEPLHLLPDPQNPEDEQAIALRTADDHLLGYLPRYHAPDLLALLAARVPISARTVKVNPPPTPVQQRVLVSLDAPWPFPRPPLSQDDCAPIPREADAP
jgi:hypothetical protein